MFIHDLIKIKYIIEGYLPDTPYHLISDREMVDAFMTRALVQEADSEQNAKYELQGYFIDNYPIYQNTYAPTDVSRSYENVVLSLYVILQLYLLCKEDNIEYQIPDWVYSYMLGYPISINSNKKDIHDLIYPLGVDNIDDDFNADCMAACNSVSLAWVRSKTLNAAFTIPENYQTAITDLLSGFWFDNGTNAPQKEMISVYSAPFAYNYDISDPSKEYVFKSANTVCDRPPTIFGEPHIIKSNRLKQSGV